MFHVHEQAAILGRDRQLRRAARRGTYKTVRARFWPWLSGKSPYNLLSCSLLRRRRQFVDVTGGLDAQLIMADLYQVGYDSLVIDAIPYMFC